MSARSLYDGGLQVREIAARLGIGVATVHARLKAEGYTPRAAGQHMITRDDARAKRAGELRAAGLTIRQIAAEMGVSVSIAHKYVERSKR